MKAIVVYNSKYISEPFRNDEKDFDKNSHMQLHNFLTYLKTTQVIDTGMYQKLIEDLVKYGYLPLSSDNKIVDIIFNNNSDLLEHNEPVL